MHAISYANTRYLMLTQGLSFKPRDITTCDTFIENDGPENVRLNFWSVGRSGIGIMGI